MARDFNGSTNRLDWSTLGNLTGHAMTVSLWAYADTYVTNGYLLCIHDSGNTSFGIIINTSSANPSYGYVSVFVNAATDLQRSSVTNTLGTGAWTHLVITWSGTITASTGVHIYKNGTETSYSTNTDGVASETSHTGSWSLGGRIYDDNRMFDGKLAEVAVWDRVLNSTEISNLASGYAPSLVDNGSNLLFYYSAKTDTTTAETGGAAGTVDGTSYNASHPTITYSLGSARLAMHQRQMQGMS